jgi:hypothetical protein
MRAVCQQRRPATDYTIVAEEEQTAFHAAAAQRGWVSEQCPRRLAREAVLGYTGLEEQKAGP